MNEKEWYTIEYRLAPDGLLYKANYVAHDEQEAVRRFTWQFGFDKIKLIANIYLTTTNP